MDMKYNFSILALAAAILGLTFSSCSHERYNEERPAEGRTIALKVVTPDTKVALKRDEAFLMTDFQWEANDVVDLVFHTSTQNIAAQHTVTAAELSSDFKSARFAITVPAEITGAFTLYGVYGGTLSGTTVTLAQSSSDASLNGDPKSNLVMSFKADLDASALPAETPVAFNCLGSLFNVNLVNTGSAALDAIKEIKLKSADATWPKTQIYGNGTTYDLVTGTYTDAATTLTELTFPATSANLASGATMSLYGWYAPKAGAAFPALSVELVKTDGTTVATADTKAPSITLTSGKTYKFNMKWDESSLLFDVNDPSRLGFSKIVQRFEIPQTSMAADQTGSALRSMAYHKDVISLLVAGTIKDVLYYDALSGAYVGNNGKNNTLTRWASDDAGQVIAGISTKAGVQTTFYQIAIPGYTPATQFIPSGLFPKQTNTSDGDIFNGAQISATGDIKNGDAVIFYPVYRNAKTPVVFRAEILNKALKSFTKIDYGNPTNSYHPTYGPFGNVGFAFPLGNHVEDGYIFGDRNEISYFKGTDKKIFQYEDLGAFTYGGFAGGKCFDMNGKKYAVIYRIVKNGTAKGGYFRILDITDPNAITMTSAEREAAGINFVVYESPVFPQPLGQDDMLYGGIDVKYLSNGNVILYFMVGGAGVRAYDIVK